MGIDPGTLVTGYGIIEISDSKLQLITCDAVENKNKTNMSARLEAIFNKLNKVIKKYSPDEIAIETAFYGKNAQSALKLGQARGVAMLTAILNKTPLTEYSPREVKKSVVGNGAASKEQVQYMVKSLLKLRTLPKHYDTTDALAVAICHSFSVHSDGLSKNPKNKSGRYRDWKSFVESSTSRLRPFGSIDP
ncbi:MAG: crossover junction endodeoxyribonuclease RuvC [Bacteroidota bacterium]|nr:crossover junction endodeoxyribonuclease RuvC [Bacteroidota bacterium]